MKQIIFALMAAAAMLTLPAFAASPANATSSRYQPGKAFAPFHYHYPVNRYRSGSGVPGPDYWQNQVDYNIHVRLDPKHKKLSGSETITYTNNSPNKLHYLWLQLDQNTYKPDARSNFAGARARPPAWHTSGYHITSVKVAGRNVHTTITDTRMRVDLPKSLAAHGGKVEVTIHYHYTVPARFGGRTQWAHTKNGDVFDIAQWFPRLCVYDDLRGWDTLPYLGEEFYLEYGDIDYYVTVPWNMIVAGSGKLMNPNDVLTQTERDRLEQARDSDKTVMIRKPSEVGDAASRPKRHGDLTWHFHMHDTRDAAFAASQAYVWDAARIDLPHGKHALAQSVYPVESMGKGDWQHATQYVKYTVEFFSRYLDFNFPWANMIAVGGPVGGMEYPGVVFDWWNPKGMSGGMSLFALTVHEVGHTWFPMIVGSNERRDAWMDEGLNTFVDMLAQKHWGKTHHGQYAPKQDGEYAPLTGEAAEDIVKEVFDHKNMPTILARADAIKGHHPITYFKAAYGLALLRDQILGHERFDAAFRQYTHAWAWKHPSPSDFFRLMDSASGEDLAWFWRGWFRHNWKLDLAVTGVKYFRGTKSGPHGRPVPKTEGPRKAALVTVANLDKLPMPATLQVTYTDGSTRQVRVPVATWLKHKKFEVMVEGGKQVKSATIDPDHKLPDVDRSNNRWRMERTK